MIKIICVGKIKKQYLKEAIDDYRTRLKKYTRIEIVEVPDCPIDDPKVSLPKEKEQIVKQIKEKDYVITLEIDGHEVTSNNLAQQLDQIQTNGNTDITFIIGGSYGLDQELKDRSNWKLSFSKLTFPHQLFRLLLLEQIYRAYKINNHESYHK